MSKNNCIYVSYMSNDRDLRGVLVLAYNLKKVKSKYKFGCIVVDNVSSKAKETLKKHNIILFEFNLEKILLGYGFPEEHAKMVVNKHYFGKFLFLNINTHDKIIYLDSDLLIMSNIDHLFKEKNKRDCLYMVPDMQASGDYSAVMLINDKFNSGVIVSNYNKELCDLCFKTLLNDGIELFQRDNFFLTDQYVFDKLFAEKKMKIELLELKYNLHPILIESVQRDKMTDNIYVLHYMVRPKPWELLDLEIDTHIFENNICRDAFKLWTDIYFEMISNRYFSYDFKKTNVKFYSWGKKNNKNYHFDHNNIIQKI